MSDRSLVAHTSLPIIVLGLLAMAAVVSAQPTPRDKPQTQKTGTGVIRGRVVRADTGEPLRRVQVHIDEWSAKDHGGPSSTMTDAEGRYELAQLPAGTYHLKATRGGYVEVQYGQRRPFERGRPIEVTDGAVLEKIDFAMPLGGVVTGRVLDEMGEAVAQASVSLLRRRNVDGERQLVAQSGSATDDRGEFRIFGVSPGEYVMVARFEMSDFGSRDRVRYVPTYYPGTPFANEAQRVTLAAGQEVSGIVIPLARASTATLRGVVRASGKTPLGPLTLVTARESGGVRADGQTSMATAASDGSFTIAGLLPGTYVVEARSMSFEVRSLSEGKEFASREVVVDGSDVSGISLILSAGATARGHVTFDTETPPKDIRPSQIFLAATMMGHQSGGMGMYDGPSTARDDWSFELQGLRGRGFIRAGTLDDEWQLKSVRREAVDVTDTPLDFSSDINNLDIQLTNRITIVSGKVTTDRNTVAMDGTVIIFADDDAKWGPRSRFIQSARPDQHGQFKIRGLPAGKYVAIAVDYLEPGDESDAELLSRWRRRGTSLTLSDGEMRTIDLKLSGS
jgi:5-hydroxyisourate hydrolase-like protein (transthyretin family)